MSKNWDILPKITGLDGVVLLIVTALIGFGIIMVFSATMLRCANADNSPYHLLLKHVWFIAFGLIMGFGALLIPTRFLSRSGLFLVLFVALLLALVLIPGIGHEIRGARRWIRLFGVNFQPSELAKIALPVFLASTMSACRHVHRSVLKLFLWTLPVVLMFVVLVAVEPDYGTAALLIFISGAMYYVAGSPNKCILGFSTLAIPFGLYGYHYSPHFRERVDTYFAYLMDPAAAPYHLQVAFTAIGSGGFWGLGLGKGMHKHAVLAESHNDFALASLAEEGGFIVASSIVVLFLLLIYKGVKESLALDNYFARLLGFGLTMSLGIQAFMNICVVLGLMPTTGINLPLVSYGGSGMTANLIAVGLLLSALRTRNEEAKA